MIPFKFTSIWKSYFWNHVINLPNHQCCSLIHVGKYAKLTEISMKPIFCTGSQIYPSACKIGAYVTYRQLVMSARGHSLRDMKMVLRTRACQDFFDEDISHWKMLICFKQILGKSIKILTKTYLGKVLRSRLECLIKCKTECATHLRMTNINNQGIHRFRKPGSGPSSDWFRGGTWTWAHLLAIDSVSFIHFAVGFVLYCILK